MAEFYELFFEVRIKGAWYLSDVIDEDGHEVPGSHFCRGKYFDRTTKLTIVPNVMGRPVDFRETSFGVPIVSKSFANAVEKIDSSAIQRIPVTVAPSTNGYEILNILPMLDCIDYDHTPLERWTEDGYILPEKVGRIKGIFKLRIRPEETNGHHIFRLAEYHSVISISKELKVALKEHGFTGMKFIPA